MFVRVRRVCRNISAGGNVICVCAFVFACVNKCF